MRGFNALWVPGIDHAGIATQAVVEKQLKETENKTRHDVGREALVQRIWKWKEQYGNRILEQLKRLGCSCDWDRTRFTLDDMCARAVRETFFKLFKDGLIYRGKRLVNWDIFLQTSVSDDEIYHETVKTHLWHIRYLIEGTDKFMVVATTRPETMLGDTAVAVHCEDPRWNWAIGKQVRLPLVDRLIPIIADNILVDPKFGTGVVKVTPAHDPNDYAVWQRHKDQPDEIGILNILTPDGKINEEGGPYAGLRRDKARAKIVDDLKGHGLLEKEEPYETQVGHSDRSKTPIEPYLSDQWFVHMAPLAEPALEVVREGIIKFYPERYAKTYLDWLGEKRDWPVSRQLWWGHRIPVWTKPAPVGEVWGSLDFSTEKLRQWGSEGRISYKKTGDDTFLRNGFYQQQFQICVRNENDREVLDALKQEGFAQDPDVLDTWFSSALWPHSTLGWPEQTPELAKYYPTSVLVTGRDIITLWVARMVMTGIYNMGHGQFTAHSQEEAHTKIANCKSQIANAIPFAHVTINPTILDGKGERMSKSKGNGVDPVDIIETHGADALRFTMTMMATETQDVRLPVKKDAEGRNTSDKFDQGRNFCNKLWNASRFAISNLEATAVQSPDSSTWTLADRWILSRLARTITEINEALEHYRFDQYAKSAYDFFWRDFCDWYVEASKPVMKDAARAPQAAAVLAAALDASLRLMHPMIPFITETIWWKLNEVRTGRGLPGKLTGSDSPRLIKAAWPQADASLIDESAERDFTMLQGIVVAIRNLRNEHKVDPKRAVAVSILAHEELAHVIRQNQQIVDVLATCTVSDARADLTPPANAARATVGACEVYVEGLVDEAAEKQRLAKRKEELVRQIAGLKGRLSNESYISKAPPHLVEQTRNQLTEAETELAKLS